MQHAEEGDARTGDTTEPGATDSVGGSVRTGLATARVGMTPFWAVSLTVLVLDQITKAMVVTSLPMYASRTLIPGLVDVVHVQNAGVAFGLLNDVQHPSRSVFTIALAVIALVGIVYYARHLRPEERVARLGLSFILGGAFGNLLDRLRQGFVTDFVDVYWGQWHFWAFNVADSAITCGAILILFELLLSNRQTTEGV